MLPLSLPVPVRLFALAYVIARDVVNAQTSGAGPSSVCDGAVTVTYIPPPFTVTVFTSGTFNSSDAVTDFTAVDIATSRFSMAPSTISLDASDVVPVLSATSSTGPSDLDPTRPSSLSTPATSLSNSLVPASVTTSGLTTTSFATSARPNSDLSVVLTTGFSSPHQNVLSSQNGGFAVDDSFAGHDSLRVNAHLTWICHGIQSGIEWRFIADAIIFNLILDAKQIVVGSRYEWDPGFFRLAYAGFVLSITSTLPTTSAPTAQPSSLSNVLSASATLSAGSLSSSPTTLMLSSRTPSLSSPTLSLSSLTVSLTRSPSGQDTSVVIPTGPSTSLSSATALPSLPSTSPSETSSTSSLSLPGAIPALSGTVPSTGTGTPASATSVPTASVLALVYCPGDDGTTYLSPGNRAYQVKCNVRRIGNAISEQPEPDLQSCMDSCDDISGCQSVSYNPRDGACSAEDGTATGSPSDDFLSATTTDLSCPGADTAQYMDSEGSVYQVLCDYSFPDSTNITTALGADYLDCSDTCSSTPTCTGFSYSDGLCTFTQGFGDPTLGSRRNGTNTVVKLAKRAVKVGSYGSTIVATSSVPSLPPLTFPRSLSPMTSFLATTTAIGSLSASLFPEVTPSDVPLTLMTMSPTTSLLPVTVLSSASITLQSITSDDSSGLLDATTLPAITSGLSQSFSSITVPVANISSATAPTSQGPTQTPVLYTCPGMDGQIILENGLSYILNCSSTTDGIAYSSRQAASSFNDCFRECDQSSTATGSNYCSAFTYEGAENGAGSGTCYLFNGVSQGFLPSTGKTAITAIRAVNYVPGAVVDGATSLLTGALNSLSGLTTVSPSIPTPSVSVSATIAASATVGASVGVALPPESISISVSTSLGGIIGSPSQTSSLGTLATLPTSNSNLATATCDNGGNILNGCVLATATLDPGVGAGVGVGVGVGVGPSRSPLLGLSLSAPLGVSASAGVALGLGLSAGSSGLSLGLEPSIGLGLGASGGLGGGLGLGGGRATSSPANAATSATAQPSATPATASTTSYHVTPLGPVVTTTTTPSASLSTTTVFTTSTVTSCLTGVGGVLTCPLGGLFTTLPSTSGAVTSISTSTSIRTSMSVSVSVIISYITVTASSSTLSTSSTFSTITTFSSSTSSTSIAASTSTCRGVVNVLGICVL